MFKVLVLLFIIKLYACINVFNHLFILLFCNLLSMLMFIIYVKILCLVAFLVHLLSHYNVFYNLLDIFLKQLSNCYGLYVNLYSVSFSFNHNIPLLSTFTFAYFFSSCFFGANNHFLYV